MCAIDASSRPTDPTHDMLADLPTQEIGQDRMPTRQGTAQQSARLKS
jgi:hypothetical protein